MFFKLRRAKIIGFRTIAFFLVVLLGFFSYIEQSRAGNHFSEQGNSVYRGLIKKIIDQGFCIDDFTCSRKLHLYRRDGKRIYFNMYSQTDLKLTASVVTFLIEQGLDLSDGVPITLNIYPKNKKEYVNKILFFDRDDELLKLELNK